MSKQKWTTPELVIVCRTRPEESVLGWCKSNNISQNGPGGETNVGCNIGGNPSLRCEPENVS